jgi:hypothetical protein
MTREQEIELAYLERRIQDMGDALAYDDRTETVCGGCCRLAVDCVLTLLIDTIGHFLAEQRCGSCRDRLAAEKERAA